MRRRPLDVGKAIFVVVISAAMIVTALVLELAFPR